MQQDVDVLIVGGGAAGMTAALLGQDAGLRVALCEKSELLGGTTATSAGTLWIPGLPGSGDSLAAAELYLDGVFAETGAQQTEAQARRRRALLQAGPAMVAEVERLAGFRFVAPTPHPDYLDLPGAARAGRAIMPPVFDGRRLGRDFDLLRPPRPEMMILGGMMVSKTDIPPLLAPFSSAASFRHVAGLLLRHGRDRLTRRRGARLVMGNALVGWLFAALRARQVPIRLGCALTGLLRDGTRVTGASVMSARGPETIHAARGVILATGGIGTNRALREQLYPVAARETFIGCESVAGEGLEHAMSVGARLEADQPSRGMWMPVSQMNDAGRNRSFPHIVTDRAKPGLLAVGPDGRRFVNEAASYHAFCSAMMTRNFDNAWLIADRKFIMRYGLGLILPGTRRLDRFIAAGYLQVAASPGLLAEELGLDADAFRAEIAQFNRHAAEGRDLVFRKGEHALDRHNGDPRQTPNPCLRPLDPTSLVAVKVVPGDLASAAGLAVAEHSEVLDAAGRPIPGLFACGNDAASIFAGSYPGPGTTLGPAMTGAYLAIAALRDISRAYPDSTSQNILYTERTPI